MLIWRSIDPHISGKRAVQTWITKHEGATRAHPDTVIFRSVGTCPSVPRSAPRSVFRDPYCKVVGINAARSVRSALRSALRAAFIQYGSRNTERGAERGTDRHVPTERKITVTEKCFRQWRALASLIGATHLYESINQSNFFVTCKEQPAHESL